MRKDKKNQALDLDRLKKLIWDVRDNKAHKGYGYADFKKLTGINNSNLARVLYDGNADFSAEVLLDIAHITGVSIDWLLGLSEIQWLDDTFYRECLEKRGEA